MTPLQLENMVENEPDFSRMVRYYIDKAASDVATEDVATPNHANRIDLAGRIIADPSAFVRRFAELIVINATVASRANVDDVLAHPADIEFVVNSNFDTVTLSI
jgi:hypothetical protein